MANKFAARGGQYPIVAEFTVNVATDTMKNVDGVDDNFGKAGEHVFDAVLLPADATIIGGDVTTDIAVTGGAYEVKVGDVDEPERYLAGTDCANVGTKPLTITGHTLTGVPLRVTVKPAADVTAGRITVRVMYVIRNRMNESQTH